MRYVIGVDEAGRGPLAGPVAVGAIRFAESFDLAKEFPDARDSKQLSEAKREEIFKRIEARVACGDARFAVRFSEPGLIDERGMTIAVRRAIISALRALAPLPFEGKVFLDGALHAPSQYEQETIIGGDASVAIISLASIAAKVSRDRLMKRLAKRYPLYAFEAHKGYGTRQHYELLRTHGPCAIHRQSFLHLDKRGGQE